MCAIFITQVLLLTVFSSLVVQTLVSASCVVFSTILALLEQPASRVEPRITAPSTSLVRFIINTL
ncbi:hypothetical protein LTSEBAI_2870 [Salmonella enterica subsp. enterica serovar Baildon str. R6-199]|nr:hypothetical protein LTSEBAI_2870 [Salmonella enterica subsp. enterica serovar Baildon str. R6-199]